MNAQVDDLDDVVRDLNPLGADVVCDASGSSRTLAAALRLVRPDGQVTKVGWSPEPLGDRSEPARAEERPAAGLVQPQLADLGARALPARQPPDGAEHIVGLRAGLRDGARRSMPCTRDG